PNRTQMEPKKIGWRSNGFSRNPMLPPCHPLSQRRHHGKRGKQCMLNRGHTPHMGRQTSETRMLRFATRARRSRHAHRRHQIRVYRVGEQTRDKKQAAKKDKFSLPLANRYWPRRRCRMILFVLSEDRLEGFLWPKFRGADLLQASRL